MRPRLMLLLLLLLTALTYSGVGSLGFVWDDIRQVVGNQYTGSLANIPAIFSTDVWSTSGVVVEDPPYYRPLFISSLAVDRALFALNPAGHHLHSLLWHLGAVAALFWVLRQVCEPVPALLGAGLFALHPVQSEAVVWISGRNDPMVAVFVLLAAGLFAPEKLSWRRTALGALALWCGLLSKEQALLGASLIGVLDLWRFGRIAEPVKKAVGVGVAVLGWAFMRSAAGVGGSQATSASRVSRVVEHLPELLGIYGRLLVWPDPLTHGRRLLDLQETALGTGLGLAVLGLLGGALVLRGGKRAALGLVFAVVTFAPSMLGLGGTHQVGERYLYLPMVGLALALVTVLPNRPQVMWLGVLAIPAVLQIRERVPDWRHPVSLAASVVRDYPCGTGFAALGLELRAVGHLDEAMTAFSEAIHSDPPATMICSALVETPLAEQDHQTAVFWADETKRLGCPVSADLSARHALAYAHVARWGDARISLGIASQGGDPTYWLPVATALGLAPPTGTFSADLESRAREEAETLPTP